ncbi:MAG: 6-bladed beta-propeller [Bacteroidetes bacterium]|nr:6-bladed beta-propeller [Bacteroidota bacterium]
MKYPKYLIIALMFLISCQNKSNSISYETIAVNPIQKTTIERSKLVTLIDIVQLEKSDAHLIGEIWTLIPYPNFIIVNSEEPGVYKKNGDFLFKIGRRGKGPGEYLSSMAVDYYNEQFTILDRSQQKIITYDSNGIFQNEYVIGIFAQALKNIKEHTLIYTESDPNEYNKMLFLLANNYNIIDNSFHINTIKTYMSIFDKNNFTMYNDTLIFFNSFDNNIYIVIIHNDSLSISARYYLDFGKYKIPKTFHDNEFRNIAEYCTALYASNYAHKLYGIFFETDNNVFFSFGFRDEFYFAIYCKINKKTFVIEKIYDDIIFQGLTFSSFIDESFYYFYSDNQIFLVMDAYIFKGNIEKMKQTMSEEDWINYEINNHKVLNIYNNLNINDNPIIFIFNINPDITNYFL